MSAPSAACCAAACGQCGGAGCEARPGGAEACCVYGVVATNRTCAHAADVGGVVVDPVVCAASGDVFVDDATIEAIKAELVEERRRWAEAGLVDPSGSRMSLGADRVAPIWQVTDLEGQ